MITLTAQSRYDMAALIEVRKGLEQGHDVEVMFTIHEVERDRVVFTPKDLKEVIWKITCNM